MTFLSKPLFYLFILTIQKKFQYLSTLPDIIVRKRKFKFLLTHFDFEMSDEQQILPCVVCNQHHEQMLMLSCLHDPCINCAAIHYVQNAPKNSLSFPCSRCSEETRLDSSSVVELQKVYRILKPNVPQQSKKYQYNRTLSKGAKQMPGNAGKNSRTKLTQNQDSFQPYGYKNTGTSDKYDPAYRNQKVSSYNGSSAYSQPNHLTHQISKKALHPNTVIMCHQHPQDELSYFCFSCNKPICPQCAIHGAHKEHEVQTTRRAIKQIKSRLNQDNEKLSTEIGHLMHKKQEGRKHLKQLGDTNKRDHDEIKRQFNRLRNLLVDKEKEFISAMSQNYERNCEETKYYSTNMDKLMQGYNVVRRNIDVTLKRDDLSVLQEFNKREHQANDVLDRNSALSNESRIKSTKQIDYQLFEDEISQLSGILETMRLTLTSNKNQY